MTAKLTVAGRDRICYRCGQAINKGKPVVNTESRRAGTVMAQSYIARFYHPEHYTDARGHPLLTPSPVPRPRETGGDRIDYRSLR